MLALLALLVSHPHPVPPGAPADVAACIERGDIFVAQPDFFEELTLTHTDGHKERAVQVLDHHDGMVGHLLILPATCRIVVLAFSEADVGNETADLSSWGPHDNAEKGNLLKWARFTPFDTKSAAHAASRVGRTPPPVLRWLPGPPVPQKSAWRITGDGRYEVERLARFKVPTKWKRAPASDAAGPALYVFAGRRHEAGLALFDARRNQFAFLAVVPVQAVDAASIVWDGDAVRVTDDHGDVHAVAIPRAP